MIKDRVIQIAEYYGIPKETFFKQLGVTSANFRGKARETPLNSTVIENIFALYPAINLEWLIAEKGEMLRQNGQNININDRQNEKKIIDLQQQLLDAQQRIIDLQQQALNAQSTHPTQDPKTA